MGWVLPLDKKTGAEWFWGNPHVSKSETWGTGNFNSNTKNQRQRTGVSTLH